MTQKNQTAAFSSIEEMSESDLGRYMVTMMHRMVMHHVLWFSEVKHQMGFEQAMEMLNQAFETSFQIQLKRLSKVLDFEIRDGLPAPLLDLSAEKKGELIGALCANWLVNDGVWFQTVEQTHGMNEAKRCNDSCWSQFSPVEAGLIRRFLGLSKKPGLEGLKKALGFRMYANINTQSIIDEGPNSFVFQMNECRVQVARKRKNLADYPCKSAGLVEYSYFAAAVDPRIRTECIGCPPDEHPEEWYCAWRFSMAEE
jgi:hypothetical protein